VTIHIYLGTTDKSEQIKALINKIPMSRKTRFRGEHLANILTLELTRIRRYQSITLGIRMPRTTRGDLQTKKSILVHRRRPKYIGAIGTRTKGYTTGSTGVGVCLGVKYNII